MPEFVPVSASKFCCDFVLALFELEWRPKILLLFKQELMPDFVLVSASKFCCDLELALFVLERGPKILLLLFK